MDIWLFQSTGMKSPRILRTSKTILRHNRNNNILYAIKLFTEPIIFANCIYLDLVIYLYTSMELKIALPLYIQEYPFS